MTEHLDTLDDLIARLHRIRETDSSLGDMRIFAQRVGNNYQEPIFSVEVGKASYEFDTKDAIIIKVV